MWHTDLQYKYQFSEVFFGGEKIVYYNFSGNNSSAHFSQQFSTSDF